MGEILKLRKKLHAGQSLSRQECWDLLDRVAALPAASAEDVRAGALKEAAGWALREADLLAKRAAEADEAGHDTSADLARESEETARGIAAIIIAAVINEAKP